jgi:NCAIR mutase (PurE)-related protein
MNRVDIESLLNSVRDGRLNVDEALEKLRDLPFEDLGFSLVDHHRSLRVGFPEVIYGEGKTADQVQRIVQAMTGKGSNVLVTRASLDIYESVKAVSPEASYNPLGRTISVINQPLGEAVGNITIVAAGTSDLPVVEEAYETARIMGNKVSRVTDVGVAGLHRLLHRLPMIRDARVIIVVAGMEGALASVVGGLVDKPVIAVPTSVGYGASFGGLSALLTMLNSCASGVSVVNIDNGFGAAYSASLINRL